MNDLQRRTMKELVENQFTEEEKKFITTLLAECYSYLNDEQRKLSVNINLKLSK